MPLPAALLPAQSAAQSDHRHRITADWLEDAAVTSAKLADDSVTAAKIAADAVGSSEIAANAVGSSELADNAVDTNAIQDNAVTNAKMADNSVGSAEIIANSIVFGDVAAAFPRGVVATTGLITTSENNTVDFTSTLYVLADVVVDAARLYKVHLHTQIGVSGGAEWHVNLFVDGTQVGRYFITESAVTAKTVSGALLWLPTSGTKDLDIRYDEIGGAATLTASASATVPGCFWVEDIGPR